MSNTQKTYLAVDLGGTKLLIGEVDGGGKVLRYKKYPSGHLDQTAASELIMRSVDDFLADGAGTGGSAGSSGSAGDFAAIGVGVVGRVDADNGVWLQIDPARAVETPLAGMLTEKFGIPAFVDNDVKAAAQAVGLFELTDGAAKNYIYINVGTGLAAACVVGGRMIRGGHFNAGEVGHTRVGINVGVRCGCGRDECVELIAAGVGFDRCARLLAAGSAESAGKSGLETRLDIPAAPQRVDVREVFALAKSGDPLCVELVENAASALANLVMNLVRVTDPEAVVLGGGVVSDGYVFEKLTSRLNPTTMRFVTRGVRLTALNPDFTGLIGAAAVAINNSKI